MKTNPTPSPADQPQERKRLLGHLRIFQAVYSDLEQMRHELVTDKDDILRYAYVYDGSDPYELEDNAFPSVTAAIQSELKRVEAEAERAETELIEQRDRAEDWADKLAYAIAPIEVIGEHSNVNNPWENALATLQADKERP